MREKIFGLCVKISTFASLVTLTGMDNGKDYDIKPDVLSYEDICRLAPFFKGKEKLVNFLFKLLSIDKVNGLHSRHCHTPGPGFVAGMLEEMNIKLDIRGQERLDNLPQGAFVTVSNHTFGALDGIILIHMIASRRPEFKVMVNMVLNYISAMRPNFIAVDALVTDDPKKRAVSMKGIREAMTQVRSGHPLGFFPAGAVGKFGLNLRIEDRKWQPTIMRLIQQFKVPVIPIYFHGHNSWWFNFLGVVSWQLRTLRLPAEVFRMKNATFRISVGEAISPQEIAEHPDVDELGEFLKAKTYSMRKWKK